MLFLRFSVKLRVVKPFLDKFEPVDNYLEQSETNTGKLRSMGCAQTYFPAFVLTNQASRVQIRAVKHTKIAVKRAGQSTFLESILNCERVSSLVGVRVCSMGW